MVAALQGGSRTLLLLSLGARAALATDVTACSGSATTECINMDTCVVNIQGANYDLKPLQQAEGNKAEGADAFSPAPVCCHILPSRIPRACARLRRRRSSPELARHCRRN
jgi:hypothetical protein